MADHFIIDDVIWYKWLQFIFIAGTKQPLREAEVQFGVTDPIVKGILRCTEAVLAAEESMSRSYERSDEESAAHVSASQMATPQTQRVISSDIIPDYRFYLLKHRNFYASDGGRCPVIGIAEVKGKEHFNDKATCQK